MAVAKNQSMRVAFVYILPVLLAVLSSAVMRAESGAGTGGSGVLRGAIIDAATRLPTACTVKIVDSQGHTILESESFTDGFRCDGNFVKHLPVGRTRLLVTRGFETLAEERVLDLPPDRESEVRIALQRRVDLRHRGWFAGDSHDHMNHGERTLPVDFDMVALAARAEDLQYLSLAQDWSMDQPTPEKLEAELGVRSTAACALAWNLEAPKNYYRGDAGRCLGHCWTLALGGRTSGGEDVISLLLRASAHDYQADKPSFANFESHQLIHDQGGAVFYTHPARWWTGPWGGQGGYPKQERMRVSNLAAELPLDTLIGPTYDGLDVITGSGEHEANTLAFELWCLLLNHGYRVAATASSDACFDRRGGAVPGIARVYTFPGQAFSLPAVAQAMARGRTFVTTGPLLLVSLDQQPPGSAFPIGKGERTLTIEAWACGAGTNGLAKLEILRNGKPFWNRDWPQPIPGLQTNVSLIESQEAWYCVRLFGTDPRKPGAVSGAFFFESKPYAPPPPVPAQVRISLCDAATGAPLSGMVSEVTFHGTAPQAEKPRAIARGGATLTVPGTARLRAQAPGYQPLTLSPFLDNPELLRAVTELEAKDLVRWETFERLRQLLAQVQLTFRLAPLP